MRFVVVGVLFLLASVARAEAPAGDELFQSAIRDFTAGNYRASEAALEKLVAADRTKALYWFNLGNARLSLKKYDAAVRDYREVERLGSKLAPAAELYEAKALRAGGKTEEAAKKLLALARENPKSPGLHAALLQEEASLQGEMLEAGLKLYRSGEYRAAEVKVRAASPLKPNPEADMLLGLIALRLTNADEARRAFSSVESRSASVDYRQLAHDFLAQLREGTFEARKFWVFVDASAGYNSNAFAVGDTLGPESEPTTELQAGAGVNLVQQRHFHLAASYRLLYDEVFHQPSLRFFTHTFAAPVNLSQGPWLFALYPQLKYETLGGDAYEWDLSGAVTVQRTFGDHDVGVRFTPTSYHDGSPIYSYLAGSSSVVRPYWTWNFPRGYSTLAYSESWNKIGDFVSSTSVLPLANHSREISIAGGWDAPSPWSVEGALRYDWIYFYNLAEPDNVYRNDKQLDLWAKLSYRLSSAVRAYLSNDLLINSSNLGPSSTVNKNYTQVITLAGVAWDIY